VNIEHAKSILCPMCMCLQPLAADPCAAVFWSRRLKRTTKKPAAAWPVRVFLSPSSASRCGTRSKPN